MADPWEIPLPLMADEDDSILYEALGRAIVRWERIEHGLSIMYAFFDGGPRYQAMRAYGGGNIFRLRLDGLLRVASAWFVRSCNQELEGEFDRVIAACRGFSDRRNEFAHGLVEDVGGYISWR